MTSETLAALVSVAGVIVAAVGGLGAIVAWGIRRIDARFERIDARFDRVDARFDRVDARFDRVDAEISSLRDELTEVKIGLARLEGTRPRLIVDGR